jgi:enoyl-CoA hydratase/carnithine racemase
MTIDKEKLIEQLRLNRPDNKEAFSTALLSGLAKHNKDSQEKARRRMITSEHCEVMYTL